MACFKRKWEGGPQIPGATEKQKLKSASESACLQRERELQLGVRSESGGGQGFFKALVGEGYL